MWLDLCAEPARTSLPSGLAIQRVESDGALREWADAARDGWEQPEAFGDSLAGD